MVIRYIQKHDSFQHFIPIFLLLYRNVTKIYQNFAAAFFSEYAQIIYKDFMISGSDFL